MKYHVFWFPAYYPAGGLYDYAGSVDFSTIEAVRAFILHEFQATDRDLEEYQIADENLTLIETGDLAHRYLPDGVNRAPKAVEPHDQPRERYFGVRFSTEGDATE